jgi:serine/threonine protein phosphatase PrpC
MVVIQETRVISVNVGDSRAILGCRDHAGRVMSHSLTSDHIPDEPNEFARIMSAGGRIYRTVSTSSTPVSPGQRRPHVWGPCRVWLPDIDAPGLAMSRSLCDDIIHTVGVTSTLEFREHHFDHCKDCVLVIATDGLWQYLSNQEVIDIAMKECEPTKASGRSGNGFCCLLSNIFM